jgi:hypothetical protein
MTLWILMSLNPIHP